MHRILYEDFEQIYNLPLMWESLKHKKVLVTGGTGLIGSLLLRFMQFLNDREHMDICLIAPVRSIEKAESMFGKTDIRFVEYELTQPIKLNERADYIFHCAAITKSKQMVEQPVDVFGSIVYGTKNMLEYALNNKAGSMVYLSSMEVYGQVFDDSIRVTEDMYGVVEPLSARSCYPLGKQAAENLCFGYMKQYGVPVKIARLAQTFGAGVLPGEGRVFAQFARNAKDGQDIILHTDGSSIGNYCYTADAVSALFTLLFKGVNGEAYNIVNEKATMMIREMAGLVAERIAGGRISIIYDIPENNTFGYAAPTKLRLSSEKINSLGWQATRDMEEMYSRMMEEDI